MFRWNVSAVILIIQKVNWVVWSVQAIKSDVQRNCIHPSIPQKCIITVQRSTIIISSFVCIHYNNSLVYDYRHLNFTCTICHNDKMWSPHLLFFLTNDCVRYRTIHIFTLNSTFVHMHGNFSTVNYARYLISYKDMFIQHFLGSSHKSLPLLMSF